MELSNLYKEFRDPKTIRALANAIKSYAKTVNQDINIMEVCGGHTHHYEIRFKSTTTI